MQEVSERRSFAFVAGYCSVWVCFGWAFFGLACAVLNAKMDMIALYLVRSNPRRPTCLQPEVVGGYGIAIADADIYIYVYMY